MPQPKLHPIQTAKWLEDGKSPTDIVALHKLHWGIDVKPNAVSNFRRRHTDVKPQHDTKRRLPWPGIKREHLGHKYRQYLLNYYKRELGEDVKKEPAEGLANFEKLLHESGMVVDYNYDDGFFLVPRRDGVDLGLVREPDSVPRPSKYGLYATLTPSAAVDDEILAAQQVAALKAEVMGLRAELADLREQLRITTHSPNRV